MVQFSLSTPPCDLSNPEAMGPALWHMLASLALGRWRLEDQEFKANLCYIARPCLKPKTKTGAEDVSVVKHLSCKHEDQSSNPQHPHRKMGMPCIPATPAFGIETGRSHESDTLVKAENFQFRERISRHPSLASACVHGHTLTCITACTPTHTHQKQLPCLFQSGLRRPLLL